MARIVQPAAQTISTEIPEVWCVFKWGQPASGYGWRYLPWSKSNRTHFDAFNTSTDSVTHVIDPLTAIGLGLVTPEELKYPPGILAAFNLLSKEPS